MSVEPLWKLEREAIFKALEQFNGNRSRAANALDISIRKLRYKIRQYQAQGFIILEANGRYQYGTYSKAQDERPPLLKQCIAPEIS